MPIIGSFFPNWNIQTTYLVLKSKSKILKSYIWEAEISEFLGILALNNAIEQLFNQNAFFSLNYVFFLSSTCIYLIWMCMLWEICVFLLILHVSLPKIFSLNLADLHHPNFNSCKLQLNK